MREGANRKKITHEKDLLEQEGESPESRKRPLRNMCPLNAACAVPVQAASRLVPFRFGAGRGGSVLSLGLISFFDFGDKKDR